MTTLTRTLQQNSLTINAALFLLLIALLVLSPAEATLGNAVKIVYEHGAAERVSEYAYLLAGGLGLVQLALNRAGIERWTRGYRDRHHFLVGSICDQSARSSSGVGCADVE